MKSKVLLSVTKHGSNIFNPRMSIDHQAVEFGRTCETKKEAKWYCEQIKKALERAGCEVIIEK